MKTVAVLLAPGFEEIEAITIIDYLRRAGIGVTTVAVPTADSAGTTVIGSHAVPVIADTTLSAYRATRTIPDAIYVPGGMPGAANVSASQDALSLIADCAVAGKLVAAICAAPVVVLAKTGLLAGKRFTCYPGMQESLGEWCGGAAKTQECTSGATLVPDVPFVHDGNVLTGRGPGTAEQYAMEFVRTLTDENTRDKVAAGACQRGYEKPTA